jgi:hypothetical protein
MDGVRYSETFGHPKQELIPKVAKLEKEGTLFSQCFNTGVTITRQGHSTIATGTWQDVPLGGPRQTMPAVGEYARKLNRQHPIQWSEPAAAERKTKPKAKAKPKAAAAAEAPARTALGPSQVVELPALPKGCTRVFIEFGNHKERRLVHWKGSFAVEGGEIAAMHPYSFEGDDKLDAKAHTFSCTAGPATDGVVLDIRGTDQTTIKMTAEPQGMTFTLGELKQKKAIKVPAPGDQLLRATMPQN